MSATRKVTVAMKPEVARWVRVEAAKQDISVSRYLAALIKEKMQEEAHYEQAMQRFLSRRSFPLGKPEDSIPKREEFYDRAVFF